MRYRPAVDSRPSAPSRRPISRHARIATAAARRHLEPSRRRRGGGGATRPSRRPPSAPAAVALFARSSRATGAEGAGAGGTAAGASMCGATATSAGGEMGPPERLDMLAAARRIVARKHEGGGRADHQRGDRGRERAVELKRLTHLLFPFRWRGCVTETLRRGRSFGVGCAFFEGGHRRRERRALGVVVRRRNWRVFETDEIRFDHHTASRMILRRLRASCRCHDTVFSEQPISAAASPCDRSCA